QTDPFLYYPDTAPENFLTPDAHKLLSAVSAAWVFGGMGSWNDAVYGPEHDEEYSHVSADLYIALQDAIVAVVNSTFAENAK
ncbi:MAG: hypothetical protein JKX88_10605, partial [Marinicaulis sp.]|nr:hypothetical protein [Marinicaulis sp.]